MAAGRGKCVEIFHVIGDTLSQLGKPRLRPDLGPPHHMDDSAETQQSIESSSQQTSVDETEVLLPANLDRLDIGENSGEIAKDEIDTVEVDAHHPVESKKRSFSFSFFFQFFSHLGTHGGD